MGILSGSTQASAIVVSHNSADHLRRLLEALASDPSGPAEVIVVDNASTDGSVAIATAAGATVIPRATNDGFAAGCHDGAAAASHDTLVFLNPDTVPHPGWLPPLLEALDEPGVGSATATIELLSQPGRFNTSGGALTYYGVAWATDVGVAIDDGPPLSEIAFPSGAAMAMRRDVWERLGGFRREFFLYHEDSDLGWRLRMAGLRNVRVSASVVAHDYDFSRNPDKMFLLERNRWLMLTANYRRRTLLLLLPLLILLELGVLVIAVRDGWAGSKVRSWWAAWRMRHVNAAHRDTIERAVADRHLVASMDAAPVGVSQVSIPAPRIAGKVLAAYQRLVARLA